MSAPKRERPARALLRRLLSTALLPTLIIGCGEDPPPTGPDPVASVSVSPATNTLDGAGATVQLTAAAASAAGGAIAGATFTWSSSDATVVSVDANGLATAVGPNGSATITATADGVSGMATVDVTTGPNGGTVSAAGGQVSLVIPAGAVSSGVTVTVAAVTSPTPSPTLVPNTAFDFGPNGTLFAQSVQMTIGYDPADIPAGVPEANLRLHKLNGSAWDEVPGSSVDTGTSTVTGGVDSFSQYAVLGLQTDFFAGSGTTHLLSVDFTPTHSYIDANDNFVWIDEPNDVKIFAFPVLGMLTTVNVVRDNIVPGRTWTAFQIGGVPGATTAGGTTTLVDVVVSENITGPTTLTLNGSLTEPTVKIPDAPQNVVATPLMENISLTWDPVPGADSYNVYWATQTGVTPENYMTLPGGTQHVGVTSPFMSPTSLSGGVPIFAVVAAVNTAGEGAPSTQVTATPTGTGANAGSLTASGTGAALLGSTSFDPTSAGGGTNNASHFWADSGPSELLVFVERVGTSGSNVFWVTAYGPGGVIWTNVDVGGVAGASWDASSVTLTGVALTETTGGGTTLTLDGTLERIALSGEAGAHGTLTIGGTDPSPPGSSLTFDTWEVRNHAGQFRFTESSSGTFLDVTIIDNNKGVAVLQVSGPGTWLETSAGSAIANVAIYGNKIVFTGAQVTRLLSTPYITLTGTLIF